MSILEKIAAHAKKVIEYSDPLKGENIPYEGRLLFNENLFLPSQYYESLLEEVRNKLNESVRFYPSTSLKEEVTCRLCRIYNLDPSSVMLTAGADEGIKLALETVALYGRSRTVLIVRPCYSMPLVYSANMQIDLCSIFIDRENLKLPLTLIEDVIREKRPDLIFVCSPNNPIGMSHDMKELRELAELAQDAVLLIDETYVDYSDQDCSTLVRNFDNVIIVRSLSKSWGLAGLRIGYIISSETLLKTLRGLAQPFNISSVGLVMLSRALEMAHIVRRSIEDAKRIREYLYMKLREISKIRQVFPSKTNFITFSLGDSEKSLRVFSRLKERRIYVRKISEPYYDDCLRVTVAPKDIVDKFLLELNEVISGVS